MIMLIRYICCCIYSNAVLYAVNLDFIQIKKNNFKVDQRYFIKVNALVTGISKYVFEIRSVFLILTMC